MSATILHQAAWPSGFPTSRAYVLFFGPIADRFGRAREVPIPLSGCRLGRLKAEVAGQVEGGLEAMADPSLRMVLGNLLADEDTWVNPDQQVTFFSVVSEC
ncbi:MAG TPA: hypothetical protein VFW47_15200 [Phenylobacterium sp.]|nr:hypothetical protein [Phenylobacterium sp.]